MAGRGTTEKVSVTLPKDLIAEVRSIVSQGEVSAFFAEALGHYLAFRRQKLALERGFGAWTDERHPTLRAAEDTVAYVRSIREAGEDRLRRSGGRAR